METDAAVPLFVPLRAEQGPLVRAAVALPPFAAPTRAIGTPLAAAVAVAVLVALCVSTWAALALAVLVAGAVAMCRLAHAPDPSAERAVRALVEHAAPVRRLLATGRLASDPRDLALALVAYSTQDGCLASSVQVAQLLVLSLALVYAAPTMRASRRRHCYAVDLVDEARRMRKQRRAPAYEHEDDEGVFEAAPLSRALARLVGGVVRRVHEYEGVGLHTRFVARPSLGQLIARLLAPWFTVALSNEAVRAREATLYLAKKPAPDQYDRAFAPSVRDFDMIKLQSQCLFAAKSRIWGAPPFTPPLRNYAESLAPHLARFIAAAQGEHLDAFVIALPPLYGASPSALGRALATLLRGLARVDPAQEPSLDGVLARGWQFSFNHQRLFITSFAPCYPKSSPRFAFGSPYAWILIQPEFSFSYHNVDSPATGTDTGVRDKILRRFTQAGRPYAPVKAGALNAHLYVRPLNELGGEVVPWWEAPDYDSETD